MAGDYSRQTHDPRKRFAAVLMQQGRVQIDADWNEQAAIALDRARRQARDTFGRAAVSRFSTVDAFRIGVIAGPPRDLSVTPGRMYVEGLLAEAFASDGTPISYLRQPFLPDPPALPTSGGANVFLDVWQREVTWTEDPALLDVALGGVDTAARLQTVWQVRIAATRQAGCGVDPDALLAPSPARLTTRAVAPPAPEDPCLIAPKTGYRGLENRLYRVEVHTGGSTAAARFKFSRDNASVRSPVTGMRREMRGAVEVTVLTVSRIGRDPALRIAAGDWVEITDEHRFLNGESGAMAQVAEPPLEEPGQDGFSVVLDRLIPSAGSRAFGATADALAERRTRIIRWDQAAPRNTLDGGGLMAVAGGMIALEEGVEVDFTLEGSGAQYRTGDYWVFAARTADASVEVLTAAPPHGPIHHVAQLAAIADITSTSDPSDCRTLWPPLAPQGGDGCCTMVVRPGEDIQAAIDALPEAGGCVCLKAGVHPLRGPLSIRRSRVSLHAEAPGSAVLTRSLDAPLLVIGDAGENSRAPVADITLEGIVFQLGSLGQRAEEGGLVVIGAGAERIRIAHCRFRVMDFPGTAAAVLTRGQGVAIDGCVVERLRIGVRAEGGTADLSVTGSAFIANTADPIAANRLAASLPGSDEGVAAIGVLACTGGVRITGNTAIGYQIGVLLGDDVLGGKGLGTTLAVVSDNIILRGGPPAGAAPDTEPAPQPGRPAATPQGTAPWTLTAGVATSGGRDAASIAREAAGMRVAAPLARERASLVVDAMHLSREPDLNAKAALPEGVAPAAAPQLLAAMSRLTNAGLTTAADAGPGNATTGLTTANVTAERVFFAIVAAAQNATVSENVIAWRGGPYGGILAGRGARLVAGNDLVVSGGDDGADAFSFGIVSGRESPAADGVEILGNMVTGQAFAFGLNGCDAALVQGNIAVGGYAGVMVNAGEGVRIEGNGAFGCRIGVLAVDVTRLRIEGNVIAASFTQGILGLHSGNRPSGCIRIAGNLLLRCGVRTDATAVAISYAAMDAAPGKTATVDSTELVVEHNGVHDTGWPLDGDRARVAHAISLVAPRVTVHGNDVTWGHPAQTDDGLRLLMEERAKPHRGIVVTPLAAQGFPPGTDPVWAASVVITDNRVRGPSLDTLVDVREGPKAQDRPARFRQALVTGNLIEHWGPLDSSAVTATVELRVTEDALVSVSANVVRGSARTPSVLVDGPKEIAWAGNATSGQLIGPAGRPNVIV